MALVWLDTFGAFTAFAAITAIAVTATALSRLTWLCRVLICRGQGLDRGVGRDLAVCTRRTSRHHLCR